MFSIMFLNTAKKYIYPDSFVSWAANLITGTVRWSRSYFPMLQSETMANKRSKMWLSRYASWSRCNKFLAPPPCSLPLGVKIPRGILFPTQGIFIPGGGGWRFPVGGARYPNWGILPPIQNSLSIKSFFLFPYGETYYFYDIRIIIMMVIHVHYCKQIILNAWFLEVGVKIPWPGHLVPTQFCAYEILK